MKEYTVTALLNSGDEHTETVFAKSEKEATAKMWEILPEWVQVGSFEVVEENN
jgi:hypothetical protein